MATTYPTTLDTDNTLWVVKPGLKCTLTVDPGVGGVTINVDSTTGFPTQGIVSFDAEEVLYTGTTPTAFTGCTRGYDNTSASAHNVNTIVYGCIAADHHNALKDAVKALEAKVGVNSNGATASTLDGNQIAAGTVGNGTLIDSNILFRRMKLENNITRVASQQFPAAFAVAVGAWTNLGSAVTLTPAIASLLMCWYSFSYAHTVGGANMGFRVIFGASLGVFASQGVPGDNIKATTPTAGYTLTVASMDAFLQVGAGAVAIQLQYFAGNAGTLTLHGDGISLFALAIPST